MKSKVREKEKAIKLRKKGYSYNDILKEIPVAKSTLSSWLKDLPLTKEEKKYLRSRRDKNISRGRIKAATALTRKRLEREQRIFEEAKAEFKKFKKESFFLVGVALYWAEGSKRDTTFAFTNSDSQMILAMVEWIERYLEIPRTKFNIRLYIHKPYAHEDCESYWAKIIEIPRGQLRGTIYKPTSRLVKKRPNYKGCLKIILPRSKKFLLKMNIWQKLMIDFLKNSV